MKEEGLAPSGDVNLTATGPHMIHWANDPGDVVYEMEFARKACAMHGELVDAVEGLASSLAALRREVNDTNEDAGWVAELLEKARA